MRIYIVGAAGSGKTTLAKIISEKLNTQCYHLDDIYYGRQKDEKLKRDKWIDACLMEITDKDDWIIEDNGSRKCFEKVFDAADRIILLYTHKYIEI